MMNKLFLALSIGVVAGCAQYSPPPVLTEVHDDVTSRARWGYHVTTAATQYADKKVLRAGDVGNCYQFAHTFQYELAQRGIVGLVKTCKLWHGIGHAYVVTTDGWVLDNRQRWVVKEADVGCH